LINSFQVTTLQGTDISIQLHIIVKGWFGVVLLVRGNIL